MKSTKQIPPPIRQAAFKVNDVATMLGIGPASVRRLIERGTLKPLRILRHSLVPIEQIERLLAS